MTGRIVRIAVLGLALAWSGPASASARQDGPAGGIFGLGFGLLKGETLYHISSYDASGSGVESELKFPLKTSLVTIDLGSRRPDAAGRDAFRFNIQLSTSLGNGSGRLKDSDWLTDDQDILNVGAAHPGLDIYSESDISSEALIIDARASFSSWPSDAWSIGALVGLLYEKFSFVASNVHQVGYGPYAATMTGSIPGRVLTYEVTYLVPFFGIRGTTRFAEAFRAGLDLGYSPLATAEDRDDHVLRHKVATCSASGSAFLASLSGRWDLQEHAFVELRGQHLRIRTTGLQTQRWYADEGTIPAGTTFSGIDDRIESTQATVLLMYSFGF